MPKSQWEFANWAIVDGLTGFFFGGDVADTDGDDKETSDQDGDDEEDDD